MPKKRKTMPDHHLEERVHNEDIEHKPSPVSQEGDQQNRGGHFGGQYEKGSPFDPDQERKRR